MNKLEEAKHILYHDPSHYQMQGRVSYQSDHIYLVLEDKTLKLYNNLKETKPFKEIKIYSYQIHLEVKETFTIFEKVENVSSKMYFWSEKKEGIVQHNFVCFSKKVLEQWINALDESFQKKDINLENQLYPSLNK